MSQTEKTADESQATPITAEDAVGPAVREATVAYAVRPRPVRPRPAPATPPAPAAGDGLARLEAAAEAGDVYAFESACLAINRQAMSADRYADVIRLALWAGHHGLAHTLVVEGARRFPGHPELHKMARILAPGRPTYTFGPADPSTEADMGWLNAHWDEYRGRWVAVRNGEFLGAATVLDDLVAQIGDIKGVMLAPVA